MMPNEVNEVVAKILLCLFATFMLCFSKAKASETQIVDERSAIIYEVFSK